MGMYRDGFAVLATNRATKPFGRSKPSRTKSNGFSSPTWHLATLSYISVDRDYHSTAHAPRQTQEKKTLLSVNISGFSVHSSCGIDLFLPNCDNGNVLSHPAGVENICPDLRSSEYGPSREWRPHRRHVE